MKTAELNIKIGEGDVVFMKDDMIEFNDLSKVSIDNLDYIIMEAKAFREYRKSRIQEQQLKQIPTENLTSESKYKEESISKEINPILASEITTKEQAFEKTKQMMGQYSDENRIPPKINTILTFQTVPAFEVPRGEPKSTIRKSKYYITDDDRLNIFRPSPYNVNIFTTVDEIKRLKSLSDEDIKTITAEYEKKTFPNKATCLRHFLRELGDMEFPPVKIETPKVETVKPSMSEKTKQLHDMFAKKKEGKV